VISILGLVPQPNLNQRLFASDCNYYVFNTIFIFPCQSLKRGISIPLKDNPGHNSFQIHKLEGTDFWEYYIDKGYRFVFKQEGNIYKFTTLVLIS